MHLPQSFDVASDHMYAGNGVVGHVLAETDLQLGVVVYSLTLVGFEPVFDHQWKGMVEELKIETVTDKIKIIQTQVLNLQVLGESEAVLPQDY